MPDPLPIEHVHHVGRVVRNLDASLEFYRDVLGFRQIRRPNFDFRGAWLFNYGLQIHLIEPRSELPAANTKVQRRIDHVAFYVKDTAEVERQLKERGIEYTAQYVADTDVTQLFFLDPDGNHIEIGSYPPTPDYL